MYGCIVGVGDERQDLILGFVAWIDVSGNLLLEGGVEAFSEAILLGKQVPLDGKSTSRIGWNQ